jgi:hypothetical protein
MSTFHQAGMVTLVGHDPTIPFGRKIFLPLQFSLPHKCVCGLDYIIISESEMFGAVNAIIGNSPQAIVSAPSTILIEYSRSLAHDYQLRLP